MKQSEMEAIAAVFASMIDAKLAPFAAQWNNATAAGAPATKVSRARAKGASKASKASKAETAAQKSAAWRERMVANKTARRALAASFREKGLACPTGDAWSAAKLAAGVK